MSNESIPACLECKHCMYLDFIEGAECSKYYESFPDYLNGGNHLIFYKINDVRGNESMCGKYAKDFEQKEVQVQEKPKNSWRKLIWDFFNPPYMLR